MSERRPAVAGTRALRFALVAALVALDLWSKRAAFAVLETSTDLVRDAHGRARWLFLGDGVGWLTFTRSENAGAAFGHFASIPHVLVGGRVVAVLFLAWLLWRAPRGRAWFNAAVLLVLAGALGNLYDNLALDPPTDPRFAGHPYGLVRDFIDVYFARWDWHFPTFNVADSCISVGAVLLLVTGLRREPDEVEA